MEERVNTDLQVLHVGLSDRWKMILPFGFVNYNCGTTVRFIMFSQYGGPWVVKAKRHAGSGFYSFSGRGWRKFVDQSFIRHGCSLLISRYDSLVLNVIVIEGNGAPQMSHNPPPQRCDWLVMLRTPSPQALPASPDQEAGPAHAVWEFKVKGHHFFNCAIEKEFYMKSGINLLGGVTLTLNGSNFSKLVTVSYNESRYKLYFKQGFREFLEGAGIECGDKITLRCVPGSSIIEVDVREKPRVLWMTE